MTYPTSDHEWLPVKVLQEKDEEIERLKIKNSRLIMALETAINYYSHLQPLLDEALSIDDLALSVIISKKIDS